MTAHVGATASSDATADRRDADGAPVRTAPARAAAGLSVVLLVALVVLTSAAAVPFVAYAPGVAVDTLGSVAGRQVVSVSGRATYPTDGVLDMTTVSVTSAGSRLGLTGALADWVDPRRDLLPRSLVYPQQETRQAAEAQGQAQMTGSQESAVIAAARQVGLPVTVTASVADVAATGPSAGLLRTGDRVTAVDGRAVAGSSAVVAAVRAHRPGITVGLTVTGTGGAVRTVRVRLGTPPAGSSAPAGSGYLGIGLADSEHAPVEADIELGQAIGGPSAGLVFALAIVDRLTPGTLPGSVHVAGTGTIADDGTVGAIGGVHQKMLGARATGATLFLAPAANCAEAASRPVGGLRLVRVTDLAGAVRAVSAAAAGRTAGLPTC